ncbi:hypothetical protein [Priestia megaterium]|uniref:hypothetical protein n=1 Tax=Priestia megaterium TaxID=1404 RepID=UPI0021D64864|nr:hypothetical protein [Priestia megaterium]MCU7766913.1 hypothetical protein [Priestia megaterium]
MELHFENWIKQQDVSEDALILFDESIKCYRVGAYRASFLMSYLGFMKALRDRLLKSEKPTLVHEAEWTRTRNDLKNDKIWEDTVITTVQAKHKINKNVSVSKVFLASNDVIEDIPYWRRKRNECAHAKDTIISYSHVDTFWLFLESNLPKFIVDGGKEALSDKFKRFIDRRYTRPGDDFQPLIKEMVSVLRGDEIADFLKEVQDNYIEVDDLPDELGYKFWREIAYSPNKALQDAFLQFITSEHDKFAEFIAVFPNRLLLCTSKNELIRFFWKESLFNKIRRRYDTFWELALILLRNELIPEEEVEEFIIDLADSVSGMNIPSNVEAQELKEYGLFERIRWSIFERGILTEKYNAYNNANRYVAKVMFYIENTPLDSLVVQELNSLFSSYHFGNLHNRLQKFVRDQPLFLKEFNRIAKENNFSVVDFFSEDKAEIAEP